MTALGADAYTSECENVDISLLELPLADGNIRQLFVHLCSGPAVQEMPCFAGFVGSMSGVLDARLPQGTVEGDLEKLVSLGHLKKMGPKTKGAVVYAASARG